MDTILDYEAFELEYAEQQDLLHDILDQQVIANAQADFVAAKQFAPVYRKWAKGLRAIWQGGRENAELARQLLADISLAQTLPFSELEALNYSAEGELDSYTLEPVSENNQIDTGGLGGRPASRIPLYDDGLTLRIVEAYRHLGYDEATIALAVAANQGYIDGEEDTWYEERARTDGPIAQARTQDLRPDFLEIAELRSQVKPLLNKLQEAACEARDEYRSKGFEDDLLETNIQTAVAETKEANDMVEWANQAAQYAQPQNLFSVFAGAYWLDVRMAEVELPGGETLFDFADLFGDDILDEVLDVKIHPDEPGGESIPMSEPEIFDLARHWEDELIAAQFSDDGPISQTKAYARGVFNALTAGESDLNDAGYRQWRWEKSKSGARAFDWALKQEVFKGTEWNMALKRAWRAFWNAGHVKAIRKDGLLIETEAKGETQSINWGLARWKIKNREIHLTCGDRQRLKKILTDKKWGLALVPAL